LGDVRGFPTRDRNEKSFGHRRFGNELAHFPFVSVAQAPPHD
jgi:hypothetical protein